MANPLGFNIWLFSHSHLCVQAQVQTSSCCHFLNWQPGFPKRHQRQSALSPDQPEGEPQRALALWFRKNKVCLNIAKCLLLAPILSASPHQPHHLLLAGHTSQNDCNSFALRRPNTAPSIMLMAQRLESETRRHASCWVVFSVVHEIRRLCGAMRM